MDNNTEPNQPVDGQQVGQILPLFPVPVGRFCIERDFTEEEMDFIRNHKRMKNHGNETGVDGYVLREKPLENIYNFLLESTNHFFQNIYKPKDDLSIYITQSWLNYTEKGGHHHTHRHANSFLSGVLYIHADFTRDSIGFVNPNSLHDVMSNNFESTEVREFESKEWYLPAFTGLLYIFPSTLQHFVNPVPGNPEVYETRISLSFNTYLKGRMGNLFQKTELLL